MHGFGSQCHEDADPCVTDETGLKLNLGISCVFVIVVVCSVLLKADFTVTCVH